MPDALALVFDIGGTMTRAGLYDLAAGRLLRTERAATPSVSAGASEPGPELRTRLYDLMERLAARLGADGPDRIVVGFPGPVDEGGVALRAPTVWGTQADPEPVAARVKAIWPGARIRVVNDLSAAGYGFLRHDHDDACIVTVSSGIGHKVFLDGRPAIGPAGRGGEIGHLRVDFSDEAPLCECGARGHLAGLACGRAVPGQAMRLACRDPGAFARSSLAAPVAGRAARVDSHLVARTFRAGDPWSAALVGALAAPLGRALAGIHAAVGVERFVIMGGFAQALGPAYLAQVGQAAAASTWDLGQDWGRMLELGEMGDDAGLIGAGRLAAREWGGPA
ncbi:ROK family protein [Methylobacterium tarhaniae]|uniref:ROK family protein n=1 Tax=Methylobacterium tarhaniae TaxID=1187852 RepID=UPI003D0782F6